MLEANSTHVVAQVNETKKFETVYHAMTSASTSETQLKKDT